MVKWWQPKYDETEEPSELPGPNPALRRHAVSRRSTGYQGRHRPENIRPANPHHRAEPRPIGQQPRPMWDQPTALIGQVLTHAQRIRLHFGDMCSIDHPESAHSAREYKWQIRIMCDQLGPAMLTHVQLAAST